MYTSTQTMILTINIASFPPLWAVMERASERVWGSRPAAGPSADWRVGAWARGLKVARVESRVRRTAAQPLTSLPSPPSIIILIHHHQPLSVIQDLVATQTSPITASA